MNQYIQDQEDFLSDRNAQVCMKNFIIKCIPEVHFKSLKHSFAGYRNVTLRQFIAIMDNDFPATPEEKQAMVDALVGEHPSEQKNAKNCKKTQKMVLHGVSPIKIETHTIKK